MSNSQLLGEMFYIPSQIKIPKCRNLNKGELEEKVREEIAINIPFSPEEIQQGEREEMVQSIMNFPYENATRGEPAYFDSYGNFIINISELSPKYVNEFSKES